MNKTPIKQYYKVNKRYMLANWKKDFIREKYNFSMLKYITALIFHIEDNVNYIEFTEHDLINISKDLYRSL